VLTASSAHLRTWLRASTHDHDSVTRPPITGPEFRVRSRARSAKSNQKNARLWATSTLRSVIFQVEGGMLAVTPTRSQVRGGGALALERRYPEDFRCQLPEREYGIGDVRRVLYRLPMVSAAVSAGETV